ncbi:hypothetical protein [Streptosporangium carneum]|uniref:Uncharacterized protein n=1 Tax=Streptosporangium carneum TaxID=47481 RepID=A0A9W6MAH4_9ACTN|nr:hypothetical protein [Streptosporangium carneum]GLK06715.1 hypothetical protein GCM10017600_01200 [Streptosporangium carneum]
MESVSFKRALVMSSDLRGYGQGNDRRHETMQRNFVDLHTAAAVQAGLNREDWAIQPGGDGELAVLPASEPDPLVADQYIRALHRGLVQRNDALPPDERFRLRVALAFGTAYPSANGYAGQAVVEACRLADWGPLKRVFNERPEANIVLVLSQRVFEDVVLQGHTSYSEDDFHRVTVQEKEFSGPAWVWAPELDAGSLSHLRDSPKDTESPKGMKPNISQRAEVINNVNGPLKAREVNFGIVRK